VGRTKSWIDEGGVSDQGLIFPQVDVVEFKLPNPFNSTSLVERPKIQGVHMFQFSDNHWRIKRKTVKLAKDMFKNSQEQMWTLEEEYSNIFKYNMN